MSMGKINSAEAHKAVQAGVGTLVDRVIVALTEYPYCSRRQLADLTGIEIASLCGVLARMKKREIIAEPFSAPCEKTGKFVINYRLNTSEVQA